jgi:hypothetical protein
MTDYETIPSTSFLEPTRYKVRFSCELCGHEWSRTFKSIPKVDPACPNKRCAKDRETAQLRVEVENLRQMLSEQRAPAQIGDKPIVKAWDQTQEIVAKDYGMTDLNTRPREGESMAPKQPPQIQAAIDNFFGGGKSSAVIGGGPSQRERINQRIMARVGAAARAGNFAANAVPPTAIAPSAARGSPALKRVGSIPNPGARQ